jgi:hypothetical protein
MPHPAKKAAQRGQGPRHIHHQSKEAHCMTHCRRFCAVFILGIFAIQAGATPIALSRLQTDLSTATISFTYADEKTGSATKNEYPPSPDNYVQVSAEGASTEDNIQSDGSVSSSLSNATATAESQNGASLDYAFTTGNQNVSTAYSTTSSYISFHLEGVTSISLSLDAIASLNLSADDPNEAAFGYWDAYLEMYSDVFSVNYGTSSGNEVFYGDNPVSDDNQKISLSLFFDGFESPFHGDVIIHTLNQTFAEVDTWAPVAVPEPLGIWLMLIDVVALVGVGCFRRIKA